eukprot:1911480-Pyramimonas_sp.AAC.1
MPFDGYLAAKERQFGLTRNVASRRKEIGRKHARLIAGALRYLQYCFICHVLDGIGEGSTLARSSQSRSALYYSFDRNNDTSKDEVISETMKTANNSTNGAPFLGGPRSSTKRCASEPMSELCNI